MDIFKLAKQLREHSLVHPVEDMNCNLCLYQTAKWVAENLGGDFFRELASEVHKDEMRRVSHLN